LQNAAQLGSATMEFQRRASATVLFFVTPLDIAAVQQAGPVCVCGWRSVYLDRAGSCFNSFQRTTAKEYK
jgi:hypothetical protein